MTTEQLIEKMRQRIDADNRYRELESIANERNRNELDDLINDINAILSIHHIDSNITKEQLRFRPFGIDNIGLIDKTFSEIIFDSCYPKVEPGLYSHYTSHHAFANIVCSRVIRLYNLHKNYKAGEYKEFYEDHGIVGYDSKKDVFGIPTDAESIMKNIYAFCLTAYGEDRHEDAKWRDFADFGKGLRIDFEVTPRLGEFRKVYYPNNEGEGIPLLVELFKEIQDKYELPLNFTWMSKIGAYYIRNNFVTENEHRFLIKTSSDDYKAYSFTPIEIDGEVAYLNLAFSSSFAEFKIKSVQPGYEFPLDYVDDLKKFMEEHYPEAEVLNRAIDYSKF